MHEAIKKMNVKCTITEIWANDTNERMLKSVVYQEEKKRKEKKIRKVSRRAITYCHVVKVNLVNINKLKS